MNEKLFLKQADSYAKARPTYPASLFQRLASLTEQHERAWDVGTGNGQAAAAIAEHYKSVVATDVSEPQLAHAEKRPNITYCRMSATPSAEELDRVVGAEGSVDLVTVATALHYFDIDKFYPIVKHVLRKPGGVFAAWTYTFNSVSPEVDKVLWEWHEITKPYRSPEAEFAFAEYKTIPFPFDPVEAHAGRGVQVEHFKMEKPMTLESLLHLWKSYSFTQTALEHGVDLLNEDRKQALAKAWGSEEVRMTTFPISLLVGTVSPALAS